MARVLEVAKWIGAIFLALVVGGALFWIVWANRSQQPSESASRTIVILDPSDTLHVAQLLHAKSQIVDIAQMAPVTAAFHLYALGNAGRRIPEPHSNHVVRLHPDSVKRGGNKRVTTEEYLKDFLHPLEGNVHQLLSATSDTISPIIEALQIAIAYSFRRRGDAHARNVLIVSDMIQNSRDWSFFRDGADFDDLRRQPRYVNMGLNLADVDNITVLFLARRNRPVSHDALTTFWENYFEDQGAAGLRWVSIEG